MKIQVFIGMTRKEIIYKINAKIDLNELGHELVFDTGLYDLEEKEIQVIFKNTGYVTDILTPDHGLIFLPIKPGMLQPGLNEIQLLFTMGTSEELSPLIQWEI